MVGQPEEDGEYGEDSLVTMLNLSPNLEVCTGSIFHSLVPLLIVHSEPHFDLY